jgi:hypothetical protein
VNAIILWNTTYLARTLNYVRGQGVVLTDQLLSHVARVKWHHIALTGSGPKFVEVLRPASDTWHKNDPK